MALGKLLAVAILIVSVLANGDVALAQNVYILGEETSEQSAYATGRLASELEAQGYAVISAPRDYDHLISIAVDGSRLESEAFSIKNEGRHIIVNGGDTRGMIYGALALAEDLRNGIRLADVKGRSEAPKLAFRALKFNFPWDSYRPSAALDQHSRTVRDLAYWEAFLDMMAENRFNTLTLWNLHPWPYMVRARNFPEANPFTEKEMEEWRNLHHGILRMAAQRGIETYLVPWNIFVSKEFVAAHGVGEFNTYPYYNSRGDRSELIKRYVRESVAQVLEEYPELTGLGLSDSEAMGEMTPEERADWIDATYLDAVRNANRPVKIIHKLPSSAGLVMDGSTSLETEQMTRRNIEQMDFAEGPVWLTPKFNWSHGHSTATLVGVHGGELRDTFFTPEPKNYKIVWTVRNEDFFALRWGVPSFVREHIRRNGTASHVGGYIIGSETYIPALDYFTAAKDGVDWRYAFERQWLFYRLWGRLLYDVDTPDSLFADDFRRRYAKAGENLLAAYELASRTPLKLASLFNSSWDHTLYSEGMMWLEGPAMSYIGADNLIDQGVLDPAYVSVADYVAATIAGTSLTADRITPLVLADQLEADSRAALRLVEGTDTGGNTALMYEVADVRAWSYLGLHLAEKLRGAVALQTFRLAGGDEHKARAVVHLENALEHWDAAIAITRPIYRDMLLTHMIGKSNNLQPDAAFHWETLRPQVVADLEAARAATRP